MHSLLTKFARNSRAVTVQQGDVVVLDNLAVPEHQEVRAVIERAGGQAAVAHEGGAFGRCKQVDRGGDQVGHLIEEAPVVSPAL